MLRNQQVRGSSPRAGSSLQKSANLRASCVQRDAQFAARHLVRMVASPVCDATTGCGAGVIGVVGAFRFSRTKNRCQPIEPARGRPSPPTIRKTACGLAPGRWTSTHPAEIELRRGAPSKCRHDTQSDLRLCSQGSLIRRSVYSSNFGRTDIGNLRRAYRY
jgi:hypothetical protein